jgi:hypothetical protein
MIAFVVAATLSYVLLSALVHAPAGARVVLSAAVGIIAAGLAAFLQLFVG